MPRGAPRAGRSSPLLRSICSTGFNGSDGTPREKDPRPASRRSPARTRDSSGVSVETGYGVTPGETLEETLTAAVRSRPDLSADAARFLGLYHRDRFGPAPLPPEAREEAFRLAKRLGRAISDTPRHRPPMDLCGEGYGRTKFL